MKIFGKLFTGMQRAMDFQMQRQTHIASNIANIDTPGYKPKDIKFQQQLNRSIDSSSSVKLKATNSNHMNLGGTRGTVEPAKVVKDATQAPGLDNNSVNLDNEVAKLTANQLRYRATASFVSKKMSILKYVIQDR